MLEQRLEGELCAVVFATLRPGREDPSPEQDELLQRLLVSRAHAIERDLRVAQLLGERGSLRDEGRPLALERGDWVSVGHGLRGRDHSAQVYNHTRARCR